MPQKCRNQAGRRRVKNDVWKKTEKKTATFSNRLKSSTFGPAVTPAEQQRLVRLLIEKVVLSDTGLEIVWCDAGWHALSTELRPGTIGAELAEMEAA